MAAYKEKSIFRSWGKFLRVFTLLAVFLIMILELKNVFNGFFNPSMWFFILCMFALWVWRMSFSYTYSYDGKSIEVERSNFFFAKTYKYEMSEVEAIRINFRRKFFQREKLGKYRSLFSDADPNEKHLLIVNQNGVKTGVMIKTTANFFKSMKKSYADRFISSAW